MDLLDDHKTDMKIAIFTNGIYPFIIGGMQKHSYYLAKYLAKQGIYVDIYNFVEHDEDMIESLVGFGDSELEHIRHYCLKQRKIVRFPGHYLVESYLLSKDFYEIYIAQEPTNFVYAQGFSGWYYAKQRSRGATLAPIGVNFHGLEMYQRSLSIRGHIENFIFRYFVKDIVNSADFSLSLGGKLTKILDSITDHKVVEIPIGIERDWLISKDLISTNPIRELVFIGRYEKRKGAKELTKIIADIIDIYSFKFHFIGDIPKNLHLDADNIIYHGIIDNEEKIKDILCSSDILVLPSYSEGMPTVILEAMALGCAVVATDVGAVDQVVDSSNGWLIKAGDISSLRGAMITAIKSKDEILLEKKRNSIQKIKDRFLWENVIEETVEKIGSLLSR